MHKLCNKCGEPLVLDANWTYAQMKQRKYICNGCHVIYGHLARTARQEAKEAGNLEMFEMDLRIKELCEKIFKYRKVVSHGKYIFIYPFVKEYFGLNTLGECRLALFYLEYNWEKIKNVRHRRKNKRLAILSMRADPEFRASTYNASY